MLLICWNAASYSDRNGRTFTILFGVAALMIGYCFAQAILYSFSIFAPLYTWIITTGFEVYLSRSILHNRSCLQGLMGNYQLSYFAGQAYQTDIVPDKNELTMRMNYVSISRSVGAAIGRYGCCCSRHDEALFLQAALSPAPLPIKSAM